MFNHVEHNIELPVLTRKTTEAGRKYFTPDGNAYPSITTVLSELSKESIKKWRKRVGEEVANKISTQAGTRGTAVHQLAEDYVNNNPDWAKGAMPSNLFSFNQIKPILDNNVDNVWFQEVFLYSDKLELAGQVDCIAEYDGVLSIIDYKTSRKQKKKEWIQNYFMQGAFYAAAFYERTGIAIKQTVIVIAVDGEEPQVFVEDVADYLKPLAAARQNYRNIHNM